LGTTFADIAAEFERRASTIVWASVSSVNARAQTRVRVMHPVWEPSGGAELPVGWVGTARRGSLARHLAANPHVSVSYVHAETSPVQTEQLYVDCTAEWAEAAGEREHAWRLFSSYPEPYGFDPAAVWQTHDNPDVGFLRLTPWRIELASVDPEGWQQTVWRASH
jgi:hypothetical protein